MFGLSRQKFGLAYQTFLLTRSLKVLFSVHQPNGFEGMTMENDTTTIAIDLDALIVKQWDVSGTVYTPGYHVLEEPIMDDEVRLLLEMWAIMEGK